MTKRSRAPKKVALTAATADRYALYQRSVQAPIFDVKMVTRYFKGWVGRSPRSLREDFCGTALLCSEWVLSHRARTATGVDLDPEVLAWGRDNNVTPLGDDASRVRLVQGDVRDTDSERHDVVMALNYSYFCFQDRATLRGYFEAVRGHLVDDGLFFMDLFGGWEAQQILEEEREVEGFTYVWEQVDFEPIRAHFLAHIHFRFEDGTELDEAFTYDWRLWTIAELRELLNEAGFHHVEVLWEEEDEKGEGTGEFRPRTKVRNDPGFNAYLVASVERPPQRRAPRR